MDFLAEDNVAGQSLLRLCSRGNAIIAELLRLSSNIPKIFTVARLPKVCSVLAVAVFVWRCASHPSAQKGGDSDSYKYFPLLFNFEYLDRSEYYENKIESSPELVELDEEFRESHLELLKRSAIFPAEP